MSDFTREDWTKFRSMGELPRAAGVHPQKLKLLVVKELTDNALDAAGACEIGLLDDGGFWVEDGGKGIPGTPQEIADLFSIRRLLTSSKQLRMPTRGALGNGLRVVAGYTLVMDGVLTVRTSGHQLEIVPENNGGTRVVTCSPNDSHGTRIELRLGKNEKFKYSDLDWGHRAIAFVGAPDYVGASSPHWFDEDAFFELCQAYGGSARDLVARFDGCKNPGAGRIAAPWKGRAAKSLTREESAELLGAARNAANPVVARRLGYIGRGHNLLPNGYSRAEGTYCPESSRGTLRAQLPFIVEAWADVSEKDFFEINVNRTPVSADVSWWRQQPKTDIALGGCGLRNRFTVGLKPVRVVVNVQTPYMEITSDGKAPNLLPMVDEITEAISKATNSAKRTHTIRNPIARRRTETDIVRGCLDEAIQKASGSGSSRYSLRQLFYQVRPYILEELSKEPTYEHFANIITSIEKEQGRDLPGIYRDTRGTLYHPHTREEISLGTLSVEGYARPAWTFNKIIYCEKEGFFEILKDAKWPERHDCALLTSKGQPTRAARDILDLMGESEEELVFFCVHDADAAGTVIYQSLQEGTKARAARRVRIENLGLEPEEALEMNLQPEKLDKARGSGRPVANYVEPVWVEWLQTNRVELNAMTSPQFIEWLDRKMAQYDGAKLVPPAEVLEGQLLRMTQEKVRTELVEKVLAEANIESQVDSALLQLNGDIKSAVTRLETYTREELAREPVKSWTAPIEDIARDLAQRADSRRSPE